MKRIILASALIGLLGAAPARAGFKNRDVGTTTAALLKIAPDARGAALGESVSALAEDATSGHWNPAGLSGLSTRHVVFTHGSFYQGVFYDYLALAYPMGSILGKEKRRRELRASQLGTVAVSAAYLNAGRLTETDNTGTETGGDFKPQDYAVTASWGASFTRHLDLGLSIKFISSRINQTATAGAVDLGSRWRGLLWSMPYTLAASVHNMGGGLEFIEQTDPLPLIFRFGYAIRPFKALALTAGVDAPKGNRPIPSAGIEYRLRMDPIPSVALRAGYNGRTSPVDLSGFSSVSIGAGLSSQSTSLDYAWVPFGTLGHTHRLSFSVWF